MILGGIYKPLRKGYWINWCLDGVSLGSGTSSLSTVPTIYISILETAISCWLMAITLRRGLPLNKLPLNQLPLNPLPPPDQPLVVDVDLLIIRFYFLTTTTFSSLTLNFTKHLCCHWTVATIFMKFLFGVSCKWQRFFSLYHVIPNTNLIILFIFSLF